MALGCEGLHRHSQAAGRIGAEGGETFAQDYVSACLGAGIYIQISRVFRAALLPPQARATTRPFSDRAFFMLGFGLFGLAAFPLKVVVFATQFASLALMACIGVRLTGSRTAGL